MFRKKNCFQESTNSNENYGRHNFQVFATISKISGNIKLREKLQP